MSDATTTLPEKNLALEPYTLEPSQVDAARPKTEHRIESFDLFAQLKPFVLPLPMFLSALAAFAICSWFGFETTLTNQFKRFERFHTGISPDTDFYPTLSELRAIVRSKVRPDQILVIVGGNSIFNGVGQPVEQLWTKKLQTLLGPHFVVVNAAFRGAYPFEAAYTAFESLQKDHSRAIYVTDTSPGACGTSAVSKTYSYFFWDALNRSMLIPDQNRMQTLDKTFMSLPRKEQESLEDTKIGIKLEHFAYFKDLWNTIGYKQVFTVWNPLVRWHPFEARKRFEDKEPEPKPLTERFGNVDAELAIVRGVSEKLFVKGSQNQWVENAAGWRVFDSQCDAVVPRPLRQQILVVSMNNCPFYLRRLSQDEQQRNQLAYSSAVNRWQKFGYSAISSAMNFEDADFCDRCHLSVSGGDKVAQQIAPKVKQMCDDLGFGSAQ